MQPRIFRTREISFGETCVAWVNGGTMHRSVGKLHCIVMCRMSEREFILSESNEIIRFIEPILPDASRPLYRSVREALFDNCLMVRPREKGIRAPTTDIPILAHRCIDGLNKRVRHYCRINDFFLRPFRTTFSVNNVGCFAGDYEFLPVLERMVLGSP